MTQMIARFQKCRWGFIRRRLDKLKPGKLTRFDLPHWNTVTTTIYRIEIAYGDREYSRARTQHKIIVRRIK